MTHITRGEGGGSYYRLHLLHESYSQNGERRELNIRGMNRKKEYGKSSKHGGKDLKDQLISKK